MTAPSPDTTWAPSPESSPVRESAPFPEGMGRRPGRTGRRQRAALACAGCRGRDSGNPWEQVRGLGGFQRRGIAGEEPPAARPAGLRSAFPPLAFSASPAPPASGFLSPAHMLLPPGSLPRLLPQPGAPVPALAPLALCAAHPLEAWLARVLGPAGISSSLATVRATSGRQACGPCAWHVSESTCRPVYATCPGAGSAPAQRSGGRLAPLRPLTGSPAPAPTAVAAFPFGCREGLAAPAYECLPPPQPSGGVRRPR